MRRGDYFLEWRRWMYITLTFGYSVGEANPKKISGNDSPIPQINIPGDSSPANSFAARAMSFATTNRKAKVRMAATGVATALNAP